MDLTKVGEVKHLSLRFTEVEALDRIVNKELSNGWSILTLKVIERRSTFKCDDGKEYPYAEGYLHYVLGKLRKRGEGADNAFGW
jgi:hypothetical protein